MDYYLKVLIGCRHLADSIREAEKDDIENFIGGHLGYIFVGECELGVDSIQTVNEVIQVALEIYHGIRKRAQEIVPVPKVHLEARISRRSI